MKKAQITTDFIIVLIIILIIFLSVFSIINKRNNDYSANELQLNAKKIANDLSSTINNIYLAGDGYNTSLFLPNTLIGSIEYNISVYPDSYFIEVRYNSKQYKSKILTSNIDSGMFSKGNINIQNQNGYIQIT